MKKRKPPLPDPPAIAAVVLDGSNVIATSGRKALERLDRALEWFATRSPDLPQMVFVDDATAQRLRPEVQDTLRARCADVTPGRPRYAVTPPEDEADEHVLEYARAQRALIVSNDRFFDYEEMRLGVITVQFKFTEGAFSPYEEATWFRPSGGAQRVDLASLV